jgi:RNA polymerase sigma factor (sigma-70 family)
VGREDLVVAGSDEQQTATSIRSGWPGAFEGFYLGRYEPMVRLAALITRRRGVAEDIVQDVFLAMAPRWDAIEHPDRYLRAAVVNRSRDATRRARREHLSHPPPDAVTPAEDPQLPQMTAVWRALGRLSPRRRTAIVLRFYEDLDDHQIAATMNVRPSTVRSLIHRATRQLARELT